MRDPKALAKSTVKTFAQPIWQRMWTRIENRLRPLESRLDALESRFEGERVTLRMQLFDSQVRALAEQTTALQERSVTAEQRADELAARLGRIDQGWHQHMPAFLNAVSSVGAFARELAETREDMARLKERERDVPSPDALSSIDALAAGVAQQHSDLQTISANLSQSIADLWKRIEFVRREFLFELSYGAGGPPKLGTARRINVDKLQRAEHAGEIRLNLGCGHLPLDEYINVDSRELPGVDLVADVSALPFERESLAEITSAHMLEHFPQEQLKRLLPYWRSLLRPGGTFRAIVPDGTAMLDNLAAGAYSFEQFREVLFGGQEYGGDFHYNLFTPATLSEMLAGFGFTAITVPARGRLNGDCYEFEIACKRPPLDRVHNLEA